MLKVGRARTATATFEIEFEIVVIPADTREGFNNCIAERRTTKIGMHHNARAVDDRLNAAPEQLIHLFPNAPHDILESWNRFKLTQFADFTTHHRKNSGPRQMRFAES